MSVHLDVYLESIRRPSSHPSSDISKTDVHYKAQRQEGNTSEDMR